MHKIRLFVVVLETGHLGKIGIMIQSVMIKLFIIIINNNTVTVYKKIYKNIIME